MKTRFALLICSLIACNSAIAQNDTTKMAKFPFDTTNKKITYSEIVASKISKDIMFKNAQSSITKLFGDYKSVLQFEDKEAGRIICKGYILPTELKTDKIYFTLIVDVRPDKFRVQITDIIDRSDANFSLGIPASSKSLEEIVNWNSTRNDEYRFDAYKLMNNIDSKLRIVLSKTSTGINTSDDF